MQNGGTNLSKNTPKGGELGSSKWHLNDKKTMTMIVDTLPVFYYGKRWATHLQSFENSVFASESIDVGVKKGKCDHPTRTTEKTGANKEGEDEGETHAVTAIPVRPSFPPTQQYLYSANNKLSPTHHPVIHKGHP